MNKSLVKKVVIIAWLGWLLSPALPARQSKLEELKKAFSSFNQAFVKADVHKLASLITDDYVHTNQNNPPVDKKAWLDYIKKRQEKIKGQLLKIETYDLGELSYQIHENTAIITGVVHSTGSDTGTPFVVKVRFTQTWILIDNQWKRAAFQDARL